MLTNCSLTLGDAPLKPEAEYLGITLGLESVTASAGLLAILTFVYELCGLPSKGRYLLAQILESYAALQIAVSTVTQCIGFVRLLDLTGRELASYWDSANLLTAGYNIALLAIGAQYPRDTYRLMFHRMAIVVNSLCLLANGITWMVFGVSGSFDSELSTDCSELLETGYTTPTVMDQTEWHTFVWTTMISLVCMACGGVIQGCILRSTDTTDTYLRIRRSGILVMGLSIGGAIYCITQTAPAFVSGYWSNESLKTWPYAEAALASTIFAMPLSTVLLFQCTMACIEGRRRGVTATPESTVELGNLSTTGGPLDGVAR